VKEQDSKGGELKGLEKEIDHAIDSLFVETGTGREKARPTTVGTAASEPARSPEGVAKPSEAGELGPSAREIGRERAAAGQELVSGGSDRAAQNLENLETHLLSLEWEISPDLIDKIIAELGFLKEANRNNRRVFQVVDVMGKVAHSLADDEGNITPESLRFLLEAKDGIKLLSDELKDKEDYKHVVLSGILARYRLMQDQGKMPAEGRGYLDTGRDFNGLARSLKQLSDQLQDEIRQLGSIARKLQARGGLPASSERVGAVLVESCGRVFAIEKESVVRSIQIPYRMVKTVWRDSEVRIRGMRFPLVNLFRLFRFKGRVDAKDRAVLLVKKGDRTLAVLVDRLLQRRDIPLASIREGKGLPYIRGVASIGRGRNIYFLDVDRMMVEF